MVELIHPEAGMLRDRLTADLNQHRWIRTPSVIAAIRFVPRRLFIPGVDHGTALLDEWGWPRLRTTARPLAGR